MNQTGVASPGEQAMSAGVIVAFIMYIRRFFEPIHRAAEELHVVQRAIAGARRIFALLKNEERITEPEHPKNWDSFTDAIRFENVSLSYNNDGKFALKDASFEIKRGEKVALVGQTGGGKSTIVNLLLRFYEPSAGRITVDGIDIREINSANLRAKFGLVLQDIFLFPGNVRDNITLDKEGISAETLAASAHLVTADRFIERMPQKYETEISERGANLSRGERQLLSFARAMVFDPQVLLLDEATSSVDPDTEKQIQAALNRLLAGRTSLIIAHRLSTILDADKILVIREGQIIERGTHRELLAQSGYYEKLYRLQFYETEKVKVQNVEQV
jgi:ATP-binding cassette subfamily B protein